MRNYLKYIYLITFIISAALLGQTRFAKIRYITPRIVYIDQGTSAGIQVGDTLFVYQENEIVATLKVVNTASNSASCVVLKINRKLKVGDLVRIPERNREVVTPEAPKEQEALPQKKAIGQPKWEKREIPTIRQPKKSFSNRYRIRGGISFQYYRSQSSRSNDFSYSQPGLNFRFKMDNLLNYLSLRVRMRNYQISRDYSNSSILPQREWRNRIYEFSLTTMEKDARVMISMGRIISNVISGMGYLDGFLSGLWVNSHFQLGAFAGTEPDWRTSAFRSNAPKYGIFMKYRSTQDRDIRWRSALAMTGSYVEGEISREYLYLYNQFFVGNKWSVYQSAELDLNRGWRKEKTHESIKLSNLYFYVQYRFSQMGNISLSVDSRQNYWNYEIRTLADSLFDDSMRRGARLSLSLRLPAQMRIYLYGGANKRSVESRYNYFYSFRLLKRSVLPGSNSLSFRFYGFDNPLTTGRQWTISWRQYFFRRHYLTLQYGRQTYDFGSSGSRLNYWVRTSGQIQIFSRLYLQGSVAFHQGDDFQGVRYQIETGINF